MTRELFILNSLFVLMIGLLPSQSFGLNTGCLKNSFSPYKDLVQKIAVIEGEDRQTVDKFAAAKGLSADSVEKTFAGTGILNCDDQANLTAQVTGNNAVITTAAHAFFDENCNPKTRNKCTFILVRGNQAEFYPVNVATVRKGSCSLRSANNDWAVMELDKPTPRSITPYRIPTTVDFKKNPRIYHVGYAKNFLVDGMARKFISECNVRDTEHYQGYKVQTDCDSGKGASGSGQLQMIDGGLALVAMDVMGVGKVDGRPYDVGSNFSASVAVDGEFKAAIEDAVSTSTARLNIGRSPVKASAGGF